MTRLCQLVASGETLTSAARLAGIGQSTLHEWISDKPEFAERIQQAEGSAESALIALAMEGARKDGRIALMMLERRFAHWRKKEAVTVTHEASDALKTLVDTRRERDRLLLAESNIIDV